MKSRDNRLVTIKYRHSKPILPRHIGWLSLFVLVLLGVGFYATVRYTSKNIGTKSAVEYVSTAVPKARPGVAIVSSNLGFEYAYETSNSQISAQDELSAQTYKGVDTNIARSYSSISQGPSQKLAINSDQLVSINLLKDQLANVEDQKAENLENSQIVSEVGGLSKIKLIDKSLVEIDGVKFVKRQWQLVSNSGISQRLDLRYISLRGLVGNRLLVVTINSVDAEAEYKKVLDSLTFGKKTKTQSSINTPQPISQSIIDNYLGLDKVQASDIVSAKEKISARFSPAVGKIYSAYCMDFTIGNIFNIKDFCDGSVGSGFLVSSNGYMATNGHVVVADARSAAIEFSLSKLKKGDTSFIDALGSVAGLTPGDISPSMSQQQVLSILADKVYQIPEQNIRYSKKFQNLVVSFNTSQPDITELIALTKKSYTYSGDSSIKNAIVVASDYRKYDGIVGFRASDVALLKLEDADYPYVNLGKISSIAQGSSLLVLGYPQSAGTNGIVESKESVVTATSGSVSAIKNSLGSSKKLIETDATIGHGNSGGPVFNDSGQVVGLATYTYDASGSGGGVFNYIRDIADFEELLSTQKISTSNTGSTQVAWDKGLDYFYKANYQKSLKEFAKVKKNYPTHPKVEGFIANATAKVAVGEDVDQYSTLSVVTLLVVGSIGLALSLFFARRHWSKHLTHLYHAAVGNSPPKYRGDSSMTVPKKPIM
jgi:serine protease Do